MKVFSCFSILEIITTVFFWSFRLVSSQQDCVSYGVHISLGDYFQRYVSQNNEYLVDDTSKNVLLRINYLTNNQCPLTYVSINSLNLTPTTTTNFQGSSLSNTSKFSVYIQSVSVTTDLGLPLNTDTYYTIHSNGTATDVSKTFRFRIPDREADSHTLIVVGVMDANSSDSNVTFNALQGLSDQPNINLIDAVLYTGNMAYNLETNDFNNGVNFLNKMQVFAAYWPFMPTAGDVDSYGNFSFYHEVFSSINDNQFKNNFFSFNLGKAHFIQINMAYFFGSIITTDERNLITSWLTEDLSNANSSSNRQARPWIIIYGYHSFYCSLPNDIFCHTYENSSITNFSAIFNMFETIFEEYAVDLYISSASQSIYERLPPILFDQAKQYSSLISPDVNQLYMVNPAATVYLIEGVGGNANTSENKFDEKMGFTLVQAKNPGYGILTIINGTHLKYDHVSNVTSDSDTFYLINTKQKWPLIWEYTDKRTFAMSFVFFVVIGGFMLIIFMFYLE